MAIKILDCTIRDGGYLNNWQFDKDLVSSVYKSVSKSGIDYVEIGFRSSDKYFDPDNYGLWRFTSEALVDEIADSVVGVPVALMLDFGKADLLDIPQKAHSRVQLYRIAVHKNKVLDAVKLADRIRAKGYEVALQLMGIISYTDEDFDRVLPAITASDLTYVYFADSYGSLVPADIKNLIKRLKPTGKQIGFHPHNNLQLAFANTLEAVRQGVDIVDGTVYGMGRGAGNLPLETLVTYLEKTENDARYNVLPVLELIDKYFIRLMSETPWGYNLPHMLSGMYGVHPNFAARLVAAKEYSIEDIQTSLQIIRHINPIGFDKNLVEKIIDSGVVGVGGLELSEASETEDVQFVPAEHTSQAKVPYVNRHQGRDFLVLANGPSLKTHRDEIAEFIETFAPIVIGSNFLDGMFVPDYHTFSNKKRFSDYVDSVDPESRLLLSSAFTPAFIREHTEREYLTLVHNSNLTDFGIENGRITSNCRTVSILSVAAAVVMGARRIFIAGLDGYKNVDLLSGQLVHFYSEPDETNDSETLIHKHKWNDRMLKQINAYLSQNNREEVVIITPTTHKNQYKNIESFLSARRVA